MLVLDAGAFVAIERGDRDVIALVKAERLASRAPVTHGGVIGQVWRGGHGRQAPIARILPAVDVRPVDGALGRRVGVLLGRAGTSDVVDAAVVLVAADGDTILTSDPGDIVGLARAADLHVDVARV
jgi:hypothetical protein